MCRRAWTWTRSVSQAEAALEQTKTHGKSRELFPTRTVNCPAGTTHDWEMTSQIEIAFLLRLMETVAVWFFEIMVRSNPLNKTEN